MRGKRFDWRTAAALMGAVLALPWPANAQPSTGSAGQGPCAAGWEATTIADGLTELENLEPDGKGGFYLSGIVQGFIKHIDAQGKQTTLLTDLNHPAGLRQAGRYLYFVTGDGTSQDGSGTLERLDLASRERKLLADKLVQPNGLLLLPDGDLLISQLSLPGPPAGISRYRPATGQLILGWSKVAFPNGLALSADHQSVYTENVATSEVLRIPLTAPNSPVTVAAIRDGILPGLDDLDSTRNGKLFVAGDNSGSVYQVDAATGSWCTIASGWKTGGLQPPVGPTSARIARDGNGWALYVTSIEGKLRKLRPPAGTDLTPAFAR